MASVLSVGKGGGVAGPVVTELGEALADHLVPLIAWIGPRADEILSGTQRAATA